MDANSIDFEPFRLPPSLERSDDVEALAMLKAYYGPKAGERGFFTGSLFDTWDSTSRRDADQDTFTADDLLAVSFLSVKFKPLEVHQILVVMRVELSKLLHDVGADRDLARCDEEIDHEWPAWELETLLRSIDGIKRTKASKLIARKRPRLIPIYDSVVGPLTNTVTSQWIPLREALTEDGAALHERLIRLATEAGLSDRVSALRVLDVIAWMDGNPAHRQRALQRAGLL